MVRKILKHPTTHMNVAKSLSDIIKNVGLHAYNLAYYSKHRFMNQ